MTFDLVDTINGIVGASLNLDETSVLAGYLKSYIEDGYGECETAYSYSVNFLWQTNRIDMAQKFELLDLLG